MQILRESQRIVVTAHRGPDGDAVGSSLAWAAYLKGLGKKVDVILPTPFPDFLRWMPGAHIIRFHLNHEAEAAATLKEADLICCLDFNTLSRLQEMEGAMKQTKARRIIIDHHPDPDQDGVEMVVSFPKMSSTCEIVFRLIHQLVGFEGMTAAAATCLYTGMMTDTGGFTYNSNNPEIYLLISMLLSKGINKDKIYRNVYWSSKESRLRIIGYVLHEKLKFYENHRASIFTLTRQELKDLQYVRGDSEGLVNIPLEVKGMRLSISLREDTEKDVIRVSLRSVDDFPCNKMASEFFNGGGHLNASGGELPFPMEDAIRTAERAIEAYRDLL